MRVPLFAAFEEPPPVCHKGKYENTGAIQLRGFFYFQLCQTCEKEFIIKYCQPVFSKLGEYKNKGGRASYKDPISL